MVRRNEIRLKTKQKCFLVCFRNQNRRWPRSMRIYRRFWRNSFRPNGNIFQETSSSPIKSIRCPTTSRIKFLKFEQWKNRKISFWRGELFVFLFKERRMVMDQLRMLEFVQLQAFARVLQQHNKKFEKKSFFRKKKQFFSRWKDLKRRSVKFINKPIGFQRHRFCANPFE